MVKVKICGITNQEDAVMAAQAGADMLGFIFYKKSPRYITPQKAKDIMSALPAHIQKIALFVNEEKQVISDILNQIREIDMLQFHGDETPQMCNAFNKMIIKAIRVKGKSSLKDMTKYKVNFFLLDAFKKDTYGGTGLNFDWQLALDAKKYKVPVILSGGLNPDNVKEAIGQVLPYAVDVSSGVEYSPGRKDASLVKKFIERVKGGHK